MKKMNYKGYVASLEFDKEDQIYVGHIVGINDIVGFHGESMVYIFILNALKRNLYHV